MRLSPRHPFLACLAVAVLAHSGAPAMAATGPASDPSANRTLSDTTMQACQTDPAGPSCVNSALADINAARAAEGVPPMVLPGGFASLTVPEQLLVLADLERVGRGLIPALGLSAALNRDAAAGAAADSDPSPTNWYGDSYAANWAGGFPSPLEADFAWMYDDGPGSGNLDCTSTDTAGCWGHRHDILMAFDAPLVMGAAETTGRYGTSLAELFVGGDTATGAGQPDQPLAPTWWSIIGSGPSPAPAHVARAPRITLTRMPHGIRPRARFELAGAVLNASAADRVELQRWSRHGWRAIAAAGLGAGARFSFAVRSPARGSLRLRVVVSGAAGAAPRTVTLRVRP
jgi:hypothetical protein